MAHRESTRARAKRVESLTAILVATKGANVTDTGALELAQWLIGRASRHHSLAENACNRELTPREIAEDASLEKRIAKALHEWNAAIKVTLDGDPRGYTVKIHFPRVEGRKPANTWGGEETGYGI